MTDRFSQVENDNFNHIATCLDPRFAKFGIENTNCDYKLKKALQLWPKF